MLDINKVAVASVRQILEPAFPDRPIKPSTFPIGEDGAGAYVMYQNGDVTDAVIDTHQSQANRIEPTFDHTGLIPDHIVKVGEESKPLTALGHRVADAAIRFSDGAAEVSEALAAFAKGNALPMAKLAPTTLLFGTWDSRISSGATGVKVTRLFNAEIRAHNVVPVPTAGQYIASVPRPAELKNKELSEEGMLDCPFSSSLGGVIVKGEIVRTASLNMRGVRKLSVNVQEYILGLGLFALTYPLNLDLRADCNLVVTKSEATVVNEDGTRESIKLTFEDAKAFAEKVAKAFGVGKAKVFTYDEGKALAKLSGKAAAKAEKMEEKKKKATA